MGEFSSQEIENSHGWSTPVTKDRISMLLSKIPTAIGYIFLDMYSKIISLKYTLLKPNQGWHQWVQPKKLDLNPGFTDN